MLEKDKTEERKARHHITQEDFTPECVVNMLLPEDMNHPLYTDFTKTFLDPCCGTGNIIIVLLRRRLDHCKNGNDIVSAVKTIYGTELMQDNVDELKSRVIMTIKESEIQCDMDKINSILNSNIICTDFFKWDYEKWKPIEEIKEIALW